MNSLERLLLASSLILSKFTEGKEDWSEYIDLADQTARTATEYTMSISLDVQKIVLRRLKEFQARVESTIH